MKKLIVAVMLAALGAGNIFLTYAQDTPDGNTPIPLYIKQATRNVDDVDSEMAAKAAVHAQKAEAYMKQGRYQEALQEEMEDVRLRPQSAYAYMRRGAVYQQLKKDDQAIADYTQALELDPSMTEGLFNRATVYLNSKQYDKALADYNAFLGTNPSGQLQIIALFYRSRAYRGLKQYDAALQDLQEWMRLAPTSSQPYEETAGVYRMQGNFAKANEMTRQGMVLLFSQNGYYDVAGEILVYDEENYAAGVEMLTKAIAKKPNAAVYTARGIAYEKLQRQDESIADFTKAIALDPVPMAYNNRGEAYRIFKQYDKAAADFQKALSMKPKDKDTLAALYDSRGMLNWELGKYQEAVADFTTSLQHGENSRTYEYRGKAYAKLGFLDNAQADAQAAAKAKKEEDATKATEISQVVPTVKK